MRDTKFFNLQHIAFICTYTLVLTLVLFSCTSLPPNNQKYQPVIKTEDNNIRYGKLSNGFRYYIKSMEEPQKTLYLNFYVEAGSNKQSPDQPDLAHGVEHLAFKATQNFPNGIYNSEKLNRLGIGMYDFGASSGPRITEYNFNVPESSKDAMDIGILWFQDIASGMLFKDEDIKQVRGELRQELLLKAGDDLDHFFSQKKVDYKLFPCSANYSNYFENMETFNPTIIKQFYNDYYRPEFMSLSVVGNIKDLEKMELVIKEKFGFTPSSKSINKSKNCDSIFFNRAGQFHIIEENKSLNKVIEKVNIKLLYRDPDMFKNMHRPQSKVDHILLQMLNEIINQRILGKAQAFNSFNLKCTETFGIRSLPPAIEIDIEAFKDYEKEGLNQLIQILSQLKKYGILQQEWESLKKKHLQYLSSTNTHQAKYWVDLFADHLTFRKDFESSHKVILKEAIENYSIESFNKFISKYLNRIPEDIVIIAPNGSKALSYSEDEVRTWIKTFMLVPVTPFKPYRPASSLMNAKEVKMLKTPGYTYLGIGQSGAKEIILENGIKLIFFPFKPTPGFEDDIIKIHGFSLRGAKSFLKSDFYSALYAPNIIKDSGVKGLNKFEIELFLASKIFPLRWFPLI